MNTLLTQTKGKEKVKLLIVVKQVLFPAGKVAKLTKESPVWLWFEDEETCLLTDLTTQELGTILHKQMDLLKVLQCKLKDKKTKENPQDEENY